MWRLLGFILIFAVFLAFIVFNLDNRCNVSFGFTMLKDMPVFITAFVSFFLGMLCAVPFIVSLHRKKEKARLKTAELSPPPKKRWGKGKSAPRGDTGGDSPADDSYGID
jgi:uncharacterized integral membrane protein